MLAPLDTGLEGKAPVTRQVPRDIAERRQDVLVAQQRLERMTGHVDEIEAVRQLQALTTALHPPDILGPRPCPGHAQHAVGWIHPDHVAALGRDTTGKHARAATEIEHAAACLARQVEVERIARRPPVEVVVDGGRGFVLEDLVGASHALLTTDRPGSPCR